MDIDYEEFYKSLRSALNNLYEPDQLRRNPLTQFLGIANRIDAPLALQKLLIEAIERLKPANDDAGAAGATNATNATNAWQIHDLLYLRYVRGYTRAEVAGKLGISERQLSREQRAAIEALALTLWQQVRAAGGAPPARPHAAGAEAEAAHALWVEDLPIDTPAAWSLILQSVLDLLGPLMEQHQAVLRYQPDATFRDLFVPPNTMRQSLLIVLGWMIPLAAHQVITLVPRVAGNDLVVTAAIPFPAQLAPGAFSAEQAPPGIGVLQRLLEHAGGRYRLETTAAAPAVTFSIPALMQIPVLMVDDNPDTIRLFERYLQETRYALVGCTQPAEIERLIARHQPRIIILDVMMPEIDGWEILVRLRQFLDTRDAIILVCSILPLGELARSLGANGFLQKPVMPQQLLQTLNQQTAHLGNEP